MTDTPEQPFRRPSLTPDGGIPRRHPSPQDAPLLARILEAVPGGIVQVAPDGAILRANQQAREFLGLEWNALSARFVSDFAGETYREDGSVCPVEEYPVSQCLATGEPQDPKTIGVQQPDGEVRWAIFTALPFPSDRGTGAVVTFVDITDRKRAEVLSRSQAQLLDNVRMLHSPDEPTTTVAAFQEPLDGLLELTRSRFAFIASPADPKAEELAIHARIDRDGPTGRATIPPTPTDALSAEVLRTGEPLLRESPGTPGGGFGSRTPDRVAVLPLVTAGRVVGVIALADAPRPYEDLPLAFLEPLLDATADLVSALVERRTKLRLEAQLAQAERLASVGTLAAGMAHEINNPLAYVLLNLEASNRVADKLGARLEQLEADLAAQIGATRAGELLGRLELDRDSVTEALKRHARDATDGAERVRRIVRDLMTFSRVSDEQKGLVDVHSALETALKMAHHEIKYRARLVKDLQPVSPIIGHDGRISQVFLNLLINAARAIEEGSPESNEIRVVTRMDADDVVVAVQDSGSGIAPEHLPRLFEPFFTTRAPGGGAGLGLSICHNVIRAHGGRIDVESEPGRGARFTVRLPKSRGTATVEPAPRESTTSPAPSAGRRRVLLVDDEPMVARVLAQLLGRRYDVEVASGLESAVGALEGPHEFDVVLCDMMMLDGTGMDVHAWVREHRPSLTKRMIFMTGGTFTPKARAFLAETACPSLTKPFSLAELEAAIAGVG